MATKPRTKHVPDTFPNQDLNAPGYKYLSNLGASMHRAYQAQWEAINDDWATIQEGNYDFGKAARLWATLFRKNYDVWVEASRGPGYVRRPAWLILPYSKKQPSTLDQSVELDCETVNESLEYTLFEGFGNKKSAGDLYKPKPVGKGDTVRVALDMTKVQKLQVGDYVSFIFGRGQGANAPLVIVVLRVQT